MLQFTAKKEASVLKMLCLLYTSDAADERSSVDLGGRRIIKKKNNIVQHDLHMNKNIKHITTDLENIQENRIKKKI